MNHLEMEIDKETLNHLWNSVNKWGRTPQQREELYALCCEAYYIKAKEKDIDDATKRQYMSVVFKNTCIDFLRRQATRHKYEVLVSEMEKEWDEFRDISVSAENTIELQVVVEHFLNSLSTIDRKFAVHLMDDTPYQDIADEMKIPLNTVKTRVHRYRAKWRKIPQLSFTGQI